MYIRLTSPVCDLISDARSLSLSHSSSTVYKSKLRYIYGVMGAISVSKDQYRSLPGCLALSLLVMIKRPHIYMCARVCVCMCVYECVGGPLVVSKVSKVSEGYWTF